MSGTQVWTFWAGPMPPWIGLCLETLRARCPTIRVLDDSFWATEYNGSIPVGPLMKQPIHMRSNIVRAFLLARHGGVWVDADCIAWRDLASIGNYLAESDFVAYNQAKGGLCSALVASRPQGKIALAWWKILKSQVAANTKRKSWPRTALGPVLLKRAIKQVGWANCHMIPGKLVHPYYWKDKHLFCADTEPRIAPGSWCWMLTSGSVGGMRSWGRDKILGSQTLVGRLFRQALEVEHG
jgi:hypothetical protein